jgi:P4 family phage/plasmid primase-like protien
MENLKNTQDLEVLELGNNKDIMEATVKNFNAENKKSKYAILIDNMFEYFRIRDNSRNFLPNLYIRKFLKKYNMIAVENSFYMYEKGCYKEKTVEELKHVIYMDIGENTYDLEDNWLSKATNLIKANKQIGQKNFSKEFNSRDIGNYINVKNGLIKFDFSTGEYKFLEHTPSLKSTIQLNVEYKPENKSLDNWMNFLNTSLNTQEERMFLQEVLGYMFIHYLAEGQGQSFFVLDGEGGNGKGTFQRLLVEILDSHNVTFEKSKNLFDDSSQNQFYGFGMIHKLLIAIGETKKELKSMEFAKMISGHDGIELEVKGMMEKLKYVFEGKLLMSTNQETNIRDLSEGTKRRIKFISMNNKIEKTVKDLDEKLKSEKDSIFIWGLEGLSRLIKNSWTFTLPESHFKCFDKHFKHSDNFQMFVDNHISISEDNLILRTDIFELLNNQFGGIYKKKDDAYIKFEKAVFSKLDLELKQKGARCKSLIDGQGRNSSCYIGIKYVENKQVNVNEINKFTDMEYILKNMSTMTENDLMNIVKKAQEVLKIEKAKNTWVADAEKKERIQQNQQVKI